MEGKTLLIWIHRNKEDQQERLRIRRATITINTIRAGDLILWSYCVLVFRKWYNRRYLLNEYDFIYFQISIFKTTIFWTDNTSLRKVKNKLYIMKNKVSCLFFVSQPPSLEVITHYQLLIHSSRDVLYKNKSIYTYWFKETCTLKIWYAYGLPSIEVPVFANLSCMGVPVSYICYQLLSAIW